METQLENLPALELEDLKIENTVYSHEIHGGIYCSRCDCPGYKHNGEANGDCANCQHPASAHY